MDAFKTGPHFYEAIVAHAGLDLAHTIVVDDLPEALDCARTVGLRTYLVPTRGLSETRGHRVARTLGEVAADPG